MGGEGKLRWVEGRGGGGRRRRGKEEGEFRKELRPARRGWKGKGE